MRKRINEITIELVMGDLTDQPDCTAIVNAANAELVRGGGVDGAIHRAAGPELERESRTLGPISPGDAVITGAYELPNRYVIHCLGPVYGRDEPEDELLANCYRNALMLAEEHHIETIAFPAISTGVFGYPMEEAAVVALKAIIQTARGLNNVKLIRMVLHSRSALRVHEEALKGLCEEDK